MAEPLLSPRSNVYSGGDLVPTGVAIGTEPGAVVPSQQGGGFLAGLNRFAGAIAPIVEAAAAFKQGYQTGLPLPGRSSSDSRMSGDRFIFQVLEDMRQRNEAAADRARTEREAARKEEARNQVILAGIQAGKIDPKEALKILGGELTGAVKPQSDIDLDSPRSDVYTDDILDNEPEAWGGRPRG